MLLKTETANGAQCGLSQLGYLGWSTQQTVGQGGGSDQVWHDAPELKVDSKIFWLDCGGKLKLTNKIMYPNYCYIILYKYFMIIQ